MMKAIAVLVRIVFTWLMSGAIVGLILAMTVGHSNHGSVGFVILAWYVALVAATIHIAIRLRRRIGREHR